MPRLPRALAFDVFGTVVDWRSGVARDATPRLARIGLGIDPHDFADRWRAQYLPAMRAVIEGGRPFVPLDTLHREMLTRVLADLGAPAVVDGDLDDWALAWRRLDPWPEAAAGLARLRTRLPVAALSNGNVALIVAMARHGGLVWDAILGGDVQRGYKPDPAIYRGAAALLGLRPDELCMVAAHHSDLAAARAAGLATAHVHRPLEYGGATAPDADAAQDWEWQIGGLDALAERFDC